MSTPPPRRYALDRWARRSDSGRLLSGGAPGRMIRLSPAGAGALDRLLEGEPAGAGAPELAARLIAAGILHPLAGPASAAAVTWVIPVRDGGPSLAPLVAALRTHGPVLVVDDGSADGSPRQAAASGAELLLNEQAPGPAGARNTGLRAARTEYVAFLDCDCSGEGGWAARLAALLDAEPELAIVAPRVRSAPGRSALSRYERACSPLDQGAHPGLVGPGRRIGYVPSAALLARRQALLEVGGFDPDLRFGEDVDLVWRLLAAGWRVRYSPEAEVLHRPRATVVGLARQRFQYGGSAATLQRRHPGAAAPVRANPQALAIWGAAALGPAPGLAALAGSGLLAASRGGEGPRRRALAAVAVRGQLIGGRHLARALCREWAPLLGAAALVSARARRLLLLAVAADAAAALAPERLAPAPATLGLRALDNLAYGAGVWRGVIRERSPAALKPLFSRPARARPRQP